MADANAKLQWSTNLHPIEVLSDAEGNEKLISSSTCYGSVGGSGTVANISAPSIPTAAAPATPPDMASVGGSGVNQLADAIGSQNQQPIQAFVVSNDVTTAQSLERNIVDGASIG